MARLGRSQPFKPLVRPVVLPAAVVYRRALYLNAAGKVVQMPDTSVTALSPLVWTGSAVKQRVTTEGVPLVEDPITGGRRQLRPSETLVVSTITSSGPTAVNNRATPITSPTTSITFTEVAVAKNAVVTNQWASYGVTFSGPMYYSPTDPDGPYAHVDTSFLATFSDTVGTSASFIIAFASVKTKASFAMVGNGVSWFFEALLSGATVASFTATVDTSSNYFGFEGGSFDTIRVTNTNSDYGEIDNLQFG